MPAERQSNRSRGYLADASLPIACEADLPRKPNGKLRLEEIRQNYSPST
jgi:hypothetical protein